LYAVGASKTGYVSGTRELSKYGTSLNDVLIEYKRLVAGDGATPALNTNLSRGMIFVGNPHDGLYCLASKRLPDDTMFIIRTPDLLEFEQSVNASEDKKPEKPLDTRERDTYLVIIAALMGEAEIDRKASGIAKRVSIAAEELGVAVSDETVRKVIKQIDPVIRRRNTMNSK
jgi:hypothetical protein